MYCAESTAPETLFNNRIISRGFFKSHWHKNNRGYLAIVSLTKFGISPGTHVRSYTRCSQLDNGG